MPFKNSISGKELCILSPNFHIHVSVSDFYIPTIGLPFLLQENMWTDPGNINEIAHRHMNVKLGLRDFNLFRIFGIVFCSVQLNLRFSRFTWFA